MFLDDDELVRLTGYKQKKKQISQLRAMGIPFRVNAGGLPIVTRSAVEGGKQKEKSTTTWEPSWAASRP